MNILKGRNLVWMIGMPIFFTLIWLWGFFLGDGSCGEYRCPSGLKYSWALNNISLDRLNRAKDILSIMGLKKFLNFISMIITLNSFSEFKNK